MTSIPFKGALLKRLISKRFPGGVMGLLDAWDERYAHDTRRPAEAPDRSTLYRWIKGSWPGSANQLVRLSSLLEIDPLCLIDINEDSAAEIMAVLYRSYQNKHWAPQALSVLKDFVGHKEEWPPHDLSKQYYNRDWHLFEIEHDLSLGINFYAIIEIAGASAVYEDRPQTFHFAYRHETLFGKQWVQYGYVVRHDKACLLVSINGHVESCSVSTLDAPTPVETWFGPSATVFRISSLHEFTAKIVAEPVAKSDRVRFPA